MKEKIYHITTHKAWEDAKSKGALRDASLVQDGFIHCSYPEQIVSVANNLFGDQKDLLIIGLSRSQTNCRVVDEDLYNLNELFPHVYGPIPVSSVFDVYPFPCDEKGGFSLPSGITV